MTPLFGCQNDACASEVSYGLDMLAEWNGLPICEDCYREEDKPEDAPLWSDLPKCDPRKIVLPAGYAVVPVEPTEAMFEAADDALDSVYNGVKAEPENLAFEAVYKAMIAAAKEEA